MEWIPLNFDLLRNPLNWLIVLLMVAIASIPLMLLREEAPKIASIWSETGVE